MKYEGPETMGRNRQQSSHFSQTMRDRARDLHDEGWSAPNVRQRLEAQFPGETIPDERTIRYWIPRWTQDASGRWAVASSEPEEVSAILKMLPELARDVGLLAFRLTVAQVAVMSRLARVYDDMPPIAIFRWAQRYIPADDAQRESLMAYAAFTPWRDGGAAYVNAFDGGLVPELLSLSPSDDAWLAQGATRRSGSFTLGASIARPPGRPRRGAGADAPGDAHTGQS